jgi:hypothetical protein
VRNFVIGARPIQAANWRHLWLVRFIRTSQIALCAMVFAMVQFAGLACAEDPAAAAARISDGAFAMLNGLNARSDAKSNATVGAVAIFAGDAQALSRALAAGDRGGASSAFATLESDRIAVDSAVASGVALPDPAGWNRIESAMAALSKQIAPASSSSHVSAGAPTAHTSAASTSSAAPPATATAIPPTAAAATSLDTVRSAAPPRVEIESRAAEGPSVRVKGFIEGSDLKRGGIYAGARELRAFKIEHVVGEQRINFDIGVESPAPDAVIRVFDADGRMAEAPIADGAIAAASSEPDVSPPSSAASHSETAEAPEIPPLPSSAPASAAEAPREEGGVEVFRNNPESGSGLSGVNTAEIPSHGTPRKSPSKRHTMSSQLGNAQITITAENQIDQAPTYELAGQIRGHGISRAGIYDNRRLVRPITVEFGSDLTNFDERFRSDGGEITIRAYSVGDQYVESSVDLSTAVASAGMPEGPAMIPGGSMLAGPMAGGYSGLLVQIQAVGPITRNLYVVSGVISGAHLSGAGLYQNGILVQRIAVNGGGLGSVLGALIPGASHNVNFNVRFNPQAGPATIRAFDSSGGYNEQPVIVAGMSPYGAGTNPFTMNPYGGNPYGSPYGANPYGTSPYGTNPYGSYGAGRTNPYAGGTIGAPPINPYVAPTNPFGSPPASSW